MARMARYKKIWLYSDTDKALRVRTIGRCIHDGGANTDEVVSIAYYRPSDFKMNADGTLHRFFTPYRDENLLYSGGYEAKEIDSEKAKQIIMKVVDTALNQWQ